MKVRIKLLVQLVILPSVLIEFIGCTSAPSAFENISPAMTLEKKTKLIDGVAMRYYEQGKGKPIVFMHGIPSSSYLWRNVMPDVGLIGHALAFDLVGYGESELPKDGNYSLASQYNYNKKFIDSMHLDKITLVVNDLGSLYGLKYAIANPDKIESIIFIEAAFMPTKEFYEQLPLKFKIMFSMMKSNFIADKMIVDYNLLPEMTLNMGIDRELSKEELAIYLQPYKNIEYRKVIRNGPGPATFPSYGISEKKGDFADELNKIATGLIELNEKVPFLLFTANPGFITQEGAIEYAKKNFKNLSIVNLGYGYHFLAEDHSTSIAKYIMKWVQDRK